MLASRVCLTVLLAAVCVVPACGTDAPGQPPGSAAEGEEGGSAPEADDGQSPIYPHDPELAAMEQIPTQDEMDALAAERIGEEDADAAFAQLKAELDADQDAR
jgi:hypothetical protein